MAVTAYASGDPAPKTNPDVDPSVDLSAVALPQTVQLYGDAFDSGDPGNLLWNWTWTVVGDDTPTSPAVLSSAVVQNPTVDVASWHNVRLFLIAQHSTTLEFSEQDPTLAPNSAFVTVRILSSVAGLQKIAQSERDYRGPLHAVIAQVEADAGGVGAHTINSHTDVVTATGALVDQVTDGSSASGLHTHAGADVALAGVSAPGVVLLEEAGTGTATVITRERIHFCGTAENSRTTGAGMIMGQIVPRAYPANETIGIGADPLIIWKIEEDIELQEVALQLSWGGTGPAPVNPYVFWLVRATAVNAAGRAWAIVTSLLTGAPTTDGWPLLLSVPGLALGLNAGGYLGIVCAAAPRISDGDVPGSGLTAQVFARRDI